MKRLFDIAVSFVGLVATAPVILPVMFLVWRQDGYSPFYVAPRVGKLGTPFQMIKLRSMVKNADGSGVDSTSAGDRRITPVGQFIRRYKLDEITQLWNVLKGDMSLVGPRPNVKRETDLYTPDERHLLDLKPGITDLASIVFSDEGDILNGRPDPDLAYNQLIRPWKSRLGLLYVQHHTLRLDLELLILTVVAIVARPRALEALQRVLVRLGADAETLRVARRDAPLQPSAPPGTDRVVTSRS